MKSLWRRAPVILPQMLVDEFRAVDILKRFAELVGEPPMQYLTRWRMQCAARLLADGQAKVSAVALQVGYESEAAFSRAFKKAAGVPPAAWRRRHAAPAPTP
jgi:AraC-like DNA-binding protein